MQQRWIVSHWGYYSKIIDLTWCSVIETLCHTINCCIINRDTKKVKIPKSNGRQISVISHPQNWWRVKSCLMFSVLTREASRKNNLLIFQPRQLKLSEIVKHVQIDTVHYFSEIYHSFF